MFLILYLMRFNHDWMMIMDWQIERWCSIIRFGTVILLPHIATPSRCFLLQGSRNCSWALNTFAWFLLYAGTSYWSNSMHAPNMLLNDSAATFILIKRPKPGKLLCLFICITKTPSFLALQWSLVSRLQKKNLSS